MPESAPRTSRRLTRSVFVLAGLLFVGLAYLGTILPGLPTTPWLLLASFCFARSSPRLQRWLMNAPVFGRLLRDWEEHRGIRRPVKVFAVGLVCLALTYSVGFAPVPDWVRIVVAVCGLIGISVILFVVPTIRDPRR